MNSHAVEGRNVPVTVRKGESPILAFQSEMNRLFHSFFGETLPHWWHAPEAYMSAPCGVCPAMDVAETDKEIKVTAEVPGLDAKDIAVTVSDVYVTIKGEKEEETQEEKKGYFRQERAYGGFQRIIALPPDMADVGKAEATINKGVLTVTVPKKAGAQSKTRQLEVKAAA